jgi:hypothetical protein
MVVVEGTIIKKEFLIPLTGLVSPHFWISNVTCYGLFALNGFSIQRPIIVTPDPD